MQLAERLKERLPFDLGRSEAGPWTRRIPRYEILPRFPSNAGLDDDEMQEGKRKRTTNGTSFEEIRYYNKSYEPLISRLSDRDYSVPAAYRLES